LLGIPGLLLANNTRNQPYVTDLQVIALTTMQMLSKHSYYVEHNAGFISIGINVPLHLCYTFQPFLRPSSGMSIQKTYNERYNKII